MNKYISRISIFLILVTLISGCDIFTEEDITTDEPSPTDIPKTEDPSSLDPITSPSPSNSVDELIPLVWVTDNMTMLRLGDDIIAEFNRLLSEEGSEYGLVFKSIGHTNYSRDLRQMIEDGEQIDIVFTSLRSDTEISPYYSFIKDGILEPLTDYLKTYSGIKLWDSIPEKQWEVMKYNNDIYGIDASTEGILGVPTYLFNEKLVKQYDMEIEQLNKPISELDSIFEKVFLDNLDNKKEFSVIYPENLSRVNFMLENKFTLTNAVFMNPNSSEQPFTSVLDDKGYVDFLKALCVYTDKGYINTSVTDWFNPDDYFISIGGLAGKSPREYINNTYTDSDGKAGGVIPVTYLDELVLRDTGFATGIVSSSEYKQEAFDMLSRIYTDPKLTNLLVYGIENQDYKLGDGKVVDTSSTVRSLTFGNMFISHPGPGESKDKHELYKTLWEKSNDRFAGFVLERENIKEEITKTDNIITDLSQIYITKPQDFDAFIKELKQRLEEAGIDRIIDEATSQFSNWQKSKK